jgi:hypothetical protein
MARMYLRLLDQEDAEYAAMLQRYSLSLSLSLSLFVCVCACVCVRVCINMYIYQVGQSVGQKSIMACGPACTQRPGRQDPSAHREREREGGERVY